MTLFAASESSSPGLRAWHAVAEVWRYRELLGQLVLKELKARYRRSVLGFLWCLGTPLLMMAFFTVVFTILLPNNPIEHFPLFILIGVLAWNLNQTALMGALHSVVGNGNLVQKVYFPREVLPMAAVLANAVNFLLALVVVFALVVAYRAPLTASVLLLPIILAIQVVFSTGVGLILATVNVFFRDV